MDAAEQATDARVREVVRRQHEDPEEHDRTLIATRLRWNHEQRLEANAAFIRWYLTLRPHGPLIR